MLTGAHLEEIREHLERAQNPLFFYDNDPDGLCSYVLLRKYINRGKGIAVRTHPGLDANYAKRAQELSADYIFVLDRPHLGKEFVEEIAQLALPIVWIDHHDVEEEKYDYSQLFVYNAAKHGSHESAHPVTYWSYKITRRVEDTWIAMMGCIYDHYLPEFASMFSEQYPEYWGKDIREPFQGYYDTEIGRLARSLSFGLKDSITHVVQLQNFLISCAHPSDLAEGLESHKPFAQKYKDILRKYEHLLSEARDSVGERLIFFTYGGDVSISSDIANALCYKHPNHVVVVAYKVGGISNLSVRGEHVKKIVEKLLPQFEHATGGGHPNAVGMRMRAEDLERFKTLLQEELHNGTKNK